MAAVRRVRTRAARSGRYPFPPIVVIERLVWGRHDGVHKPSSWGWV